MNDNARIAKEMINIAKEIVSLSPYPVDYKLQNPQTKEYVHKGLSEYVTELETMVKMLDKDGSVCRDKMLEVLKSMEEYARVNL